MIVVTVSDCSQASGLWCFRTLTVYNGYLYLLYHRSTAPYKALGLRDTEGEESCSHTSYRAKACVSQPFHWSFKYHPIYHVCPKCIQIYHHWPCFRDVLGCHPPHRPFKECLGNHSGDVSQSRISQFTSQFRPKVKPSLIQRGGWNPFSQ